MRALRDVSPAVRAVVTVAATSLFLVLVAWATLIGPDEAFTGPGPRPAPAAPRTESCIPLPVRTAADGTTTVVIPDDYNQRDYCEPPADTLQDNRDFVEQHPPPFWVNVLVTVLLLALLVVIVLGALWLVVVAARSVRRRREPRERADVGFEVLAEPQRVGEAVVADAGEQEEVLRAGDPRNAIVATWHRFEVQGERAGVPRRASETSSEYALRILDLADADVAPVNRLAELYREARFSDHEITERHRAEALDALHAIRASLGARA
ncbi:DUF4129 domain-containing protein [Nocardioides KLBMP 9356]|uniref:DUF4129 domain-containing protein n=1 Tax=Nocardioides potassii TaxID=2911371 RepID=A0ABS9HI89_9ACTN|nr:DUF4129 domain-containing protein [Nocardioides potassii]MCF6379838.1 DUF4129 domain-containing protein [Nocardioides potassii]